MALTCFDYVVIVSLTVFSLCQCVQQCYKGYGRTFQDRFFVIRPYDSLTYEDVQEGCHEYKLKLLELQSEDDADKLLEILETQQKNNSVFMIEPNLDRQVVSWVRLRRNNVTWRYDNGFTIDVNFTLWAEQQDEADVSQADCVRAVVYSAGGGEPRRVRFEQHACTDLYKSAPTVQNPVYICEGVGWNRPAYKKCRFPKICPGHSGQTGGTTFICHDRLSEFKECLPFYFTNLSVLSPCPYNAYGCYCMHGCNKCLNKSMCDIYTGNCQKGMCPEGYIGDHCDDKACPWGTYAENCSLSCPCKDNASCHWNTGDCHNAICHNRGYGGVECDKMCNAGDGCLACHKTNHTSCNLCKEGYTVSKGGACRKVVLQKRRHSMWLAITSIMALMLLVLVSSFAFLIIWINKQKEQMVKNRNEFRQSSASRSSFQNSIYSHIR